MAPSGLKAPMQIDKATPPKIQPHKSTRFYEYVPDLELRLGIREGTYLRVNSKKHRDDQLKLLVRDAKKEKTPQMIAEQRAARAMRTMKRLHAKLRTIAKNQMVTGAATPVVMPTEPMVVKVDQPVASVVNPPKPAVLIEPQMSESSETSPMLVNLPVVNAMAAVVKDVAVKVELQGEVTADSKANYQALIAKAVISASKNPALIRALAKIDKIKEQEQMEAQAAAIAARRVQSLKASRAAKAAIAAARAAVARAERLAKAERNMEAAQAAARATVPARTAVKPQWLRQVRSEPSLQQAIAPSTSQSAMLSNKAMMKRTLGKNKSLPTEKGSTDESVASSAESSSAAEIRAAKRAKFMERAARMPGVRVDGHGPNGRTIEGSLMKWWDGPVLIACHCHVCLMTPTSFVRHAGHVDITNPMKLISLFFPPNLTL